MTFLPTRIKGNTAREFLLQHPIIIDDIDYLKKRVSHKYA
jgi:hypothetical protein